VERPKGQRQKPAKPMRHYFCGLGDIAARRQQIIVWVAVGSSADPQQHFAADIHACPMNPSVLPFADLEDRREVCGG